jgi:hypothetical protein
VILVVGLDIVVVEPCNSFGVSHAAEGTRRSIKVGVECGDIACALGVSMQDVNHAADEILDGVEKIVEYDESSFRSMCVYSDRWRRV